MFLLNVQFMWKLKLNFIQIFFSELLTGYMSLSMSINHTFHLHIWTHSHTFTHTHTYSHIHTLTHSHTFIHTHSYTHSHTYMGFQWPKWTVYQSVTWVFSKVSSVVDIMRHFPANDRNDLVCQKHDALTLLSAFLVRSQRGWITPSWHWLMKVTSN